MLKHMRRDEYIEICPEELRKQIEAKGFTHADLALRLQISTKSVQRWLNQSIKRMKVSNLRSLAKVLDVAPDVLTKKEIIRSRAVNKSFENLCAEHMLYRVFANDDWERYASLLRAFDGQDLSSHQEAMLYKNLGMTSMYGGKMKASKKYLDRAYALAESLGDVDLQVRCLSWQILRCKFRGDLPGAEVYMNVGDALLPSVIEPKVRCIYLAKAVHVYFHTGRLDEAVTLLRRTVMDYYQVSKPEMTFVAFSYMHMAWAYLKNRNYAMAKVAAKRGVDVSRKAGWVKGQSMGYMLQGLMELWLNGDSDVSRSLFGKAQGFKRHIPHRGLETRIEQMEFLRCLLLNDYEKAFSIVTARLMESRKSRLYFSYTVLDALFLLKLRPELGKMRPSLLERAIETFSHNRHHLALRALTALQSKEQITQEEFFDLYVF